MAGNPRWGFRSPVSSDFLYYRDPRRYARNSPRGRGSRCRHGRAGWPRDASLAFLRSPRDIGEVGTIPWFFSCRFPFGGMQSCNRSRPFQFLVTATRCTFVACLLLSFIFARLPGAAEVPRWMATGPMSVLTDQDVLCGVFRFDVGRCQLRFSIDDLGRVAGIRQLHPDQPMP